MRNVNQKVQARFLEKLVVRRRGQRRSRKGGKCALGRVYLSRIVMRYDNTQWAPRPQP